MLIPQVPTQAFLKQAAQDIVSILQQPISTKTIKAKVINDV